MTKANVLRQQACMGRYSAYDSSLAKRRFERKVMSLRREALRWRAVCE